MSSIYSRGKAAARLCIGIAVASTALLGVRALSDVPPLWLAGGAAHAASSSPDSEVLARASHAFNEIARSAMPAVVSISTVHKGSGKMASLPDLPPGLGAPDDSHAPDSHSPLLGPSTPPPRMLGIGSGILIRKDGMILTNNHVIEGADKITVMFDEKHKARGRLVAADPKTDLAIIHVEGPHTGDYPVIHFGDSEQLHEGDWAIAIGSPFGLNRSMSFGIISAKGRAQVGILDIEDFIQTDAAINPGSSGGPLLNSRGELVGVNTAIFSESGGSMGIGFAIPSRIAQEVTNELLAHGHVSRGWLGLTAQDLDSDLAKYFKVGGTQGALVGEVAPGGPAGQAKLQTGDVITQYDHHAIDGASSLKSLVGKTKAGSSVGVQVIRNSQPMTVHVAIREAPTGEPPTAQQAGQAAPEPDRHMPGFGLSVEDVPGEISELLRLKSHEGALVVGIRPGSPAFEAGIGPGDIILSANRAQVHNAREFNRIAHDLNKADQDLAVLFVQRGPAERIYVPIKLIGDPGV